MLIITLNRNIYTKMFNSMSNLNAKTSTLDAITKLKKKKTILRNLNYF